MADSKWTLIHRVPMLPTMYPMLWSFGVQTLLYALFFVLLLRNGRKSFAPVDNIVRHVIDLNKSIRDSEPLSMENFSISRSTNFLKRLRIGSMVSSFSIWTG